MVALAAVAATCSLAAARTAIRATRATVPSLAGGHVPVPADPKAIDRVVCFDGAMGVSLASGGTAGDVAWLAFAPAKSGWRVLRSEGGYKLGLYADGGRLDVVLPVYKKSDPNCCPSGGFDWAGYLYAGGKLELVGIWHTAKFKRP